MKLEIELPLPKHFAHDGVTEAEWAQALLMRLLEPHWFTEGMYPPAHVVKQYFPYKKAGVSWDVVAEGAYAAFVEKAEEQVSKSLKDKFIWGAGDVEVTKKG